MKGLDGISIGRPHIRSDWGRFFDLRIGISGRLMRAGIHLVRQELICRGSIG
jgi:hypothetical protein